MKYFLAGLLVLSFSTASLANNLINGAGSTFAEPLYTKWFHEYQSSDAQAQFNYQGIGSGAGIKQMIAGTVDFAGTDVPLNAEETAQAKNVVHIPIALGAVVVIYNLADLKAPLKLNGPVIAEIFNGGITKWNDAKIQKINPGVKLPDQSMAVATRSDGSGTTGVFSEYLAKVSTAWKGKDGKTVNWFKGSMGAKGNAGVAGLVKQAPGGVGYVELVYAVENKLAYADVQNKSGQFVTASTATVSKAASGTSKDAIAKEFKISITDTPAKDAYPISSFTWLLVHGQMTAEKGNSIKKFATWTMGDGAQKLATDINYAPVPVDLRKAVVAKVEKIEIK